MFDKDVILDQKAEDSWRSEEKLAEESLAGYRKEPKWAGKVFMQDEATCYKDGFLAGLKAGKPQWHRRGLYGDSYGDSYGEKFRRYEDRIRELEKQVDKMKAVLQKIYDTDCEVYSIRCAVAECLGIKEEHNAE